ncbi:hypothetical protein L602_001500001070 [Cupriavidus gilardii J11]|uniref:Uncharacterized protein n=1 Tax=Cupriavidus gilardii J11 TaxID=936133 RepID=A0A562BS58_9BURK|nr:hypothetical protein L602_001500001070 [Cupriavidus gilardii J11]
MNRAFSIRLTPCTVGRILSRACCRCRETSAQHRHLAGRPEIVLPCLGRRGQAECCRPCTGTTMRCRQRAHHSCGSHTPTPHSRHRRCIGRRPPRKCTFSLPGKCRRVAVGPVAAVVLEGHRQRILRTPKPSPSDTRAGNCSLSVRGRSKPAPAPPVGRTSTLQRLTSPLCTFEKFCSSVASWIVALGLEDCLEPDGVARLHSAVHVQQLNPRHPR